MQNVSCNHLNVCYKIIKKCVQILIFDPHSSDADIYNDVQKYDNCITRFSKAYSHYKRQLVFH